MPNKIKIKGLRLTIWRRAANMLNVQFGEITKLKDGSIGEWALHVQCPWRLIDGDKVVVGSSDLYEPAVKSKNFDWEKWYDDAAWENNKMEKIVRALLKGYDRRTSSIINKTRSLVVNTIRITKYNDCTITFNCGRSLQLFANGVTGEHFRFIHHGSQKHHVYV